MNCMDDQKTFVEYALGYAEKRTFKIKERKLNAKHLNKRLKHELIVSYLLGAERILHIVNDVYKNNQSLTAAELIGEVHIAIADIHNIVCDLSGFGDSMRVDLEDVIRNLVEPA